MDRNTLTALFLLNNRCVNINTILHGTDISPPQPTFEDSDDQNNRYDEPSGDDSNTITANKEIKPRTNSPKTDWRKKPQPLKATYL